MEHRLAAQEAIAAGASPRAADLRSADSAGEVIPPPESSVRLTDRRQMGQVLMWLHLWSAALILVWLALAADRGVAKGWLVLLALTLAALGVAVGVLRPALRIQSYSLLLALVVSMLGVAISLSGRDLSPLYLLYLALAAFAAWYLPRRDLSLQVVWIIASYGLVLLVDRDAVQSQWWQISNVDASRWLLLAGTVVASAALVRVFRVASVENEQRFLVAFERSATPMSLADLNGRLIHVNEAFCELLDRPVEELVGMTVAAITDPRDRPAAHEFFDLREDSLRREKRLRRRDGTSIWIDVASSRVDDHRGKPMYYFAQALDITARRAAEQAAAAQASRQAAIADLGQAAVQGIAVETLSRQVTELAVDRLGLELAVLLEHDPQAPHDRVIAARGPGAHAVNAAAGKGWPLVESALAEGEALVVEDWAREARFQMSGLERALPVRSAVAVLVRGTQTPFGVLIAESRSPCEFNAGDVNFLRGLANTLGAAMEKQRVQNEAAYAATHDELTGLPNRALLLDLLQHSLAQPIRPQSSMAVVVIDLDHLNQVNESFGHEVGDRLLKDVAARFSSALRVWDTLARFGADEFVVICGELPTERAAIRVVERMLSALAAPFHVEGEELIVTASVGIALASNDRAPESLLRDAEAAMHRAKQFSPGSYQLFDPATHARSAGRLRTENALRRAIGTDEISLVYQPVLSMASGGISGVEALLRWRHPDWGPVSPVEFIPIAEESGLIIPLGRAVLREGIRQLATWLPNTHQVLSVNISARQLYDDALVELTATILKQYEVAAESLIFELTESALADDSESAVAVMQAIKDLGVRLALDDYGTGWASLGYLSTFPFDIVKLDRSLIRMIENSPKDEIIVGSTIEMGHALDLLVVAEGVETHGQDAKLRDLGCDLVQGYYHARPMPPDELEGLPTWGGSITRSPVAAA